MTTSFGAFASSGILIATPRASSAERRALTQQSMYTRSRHSPWVNMYYRSPKAEETEKARMILRERGDARELMANRQCRADIVGSVLHNVEQTERDKKQKSARVLDWLVASGTDPTSNDEACEGARGAEPADDSFSTDSTMVQIAPSQVSSQAVGNISVQDFACAQCTPKPSVSTEQSSKPAHGTPRKNTSDWKETMGTPRFYIQNVLSRMRSVIDSFEPAAGIVHDSCVNPSLQYEASMGEQDSGAILSAMTASTVALSAAKAEIETRLKRYEQEIAIGGGLAQTDAWGGVVGPSELQELRGYTGKSQTEKLKARRSESDAPSPRTPLHPSRDSEWERDQAASIQSQLHPVGEGYPERLQSGHRSAGKTAQEVLIGKVACGSARPTMTVDMQEDVEISSSQAVAFGKGSLYQAASTPVVQPTVQLPSRAQKPLRAVLADDVSMERERALNFSHAMYRSNEIKQNVQGIMQHLQGVMSGHSVSTAGETSTASVSDMPQHPVTQHKLSSNNDSLLMPFASTFRGQHNRALEALSPSRTRVHHASERGSGTIPDLSAISDNHSRYKPPALHLTSIPSSHSKYHQSLSSHGSIQSGHQHPQWVPPHKFQYEFQSSNARMPTSVSVQPQQVSGPRQYSLDFRASEYANHDIRAQHGGFHLRSHGDFSHLWRERGHLGAASREETPVVPRVRRGAVAHQRFRHGEVMLISSEYGA